MPSEGDEVFRFYNPYSGDHHYTMDKDEYGHLGEIGWRQEGVVFHSADASSVNGNLEATSQGKAIFQPGQCASAVSAGRF